MSIGIMGAMREEIALILADMNIVSQESIGGRTYYYGVLHNKDVVLTFSRWGKVASASTATTMLNHFKVRELIFSGLAGAADPELNIGDIVIATELVQHDLDARPYFPKYQVPLLELSRFRVDPHLQKLAKSAAKSFISDDITSEIPSDILNEFHITKPTVWEGLIASGDQFIAQSRTLTKILESLPGLKCVEMEGAAVAQVCYEHKIPFVVIRTVSDKADHTAEVDFPLFVSQIASHYSRGIVRNLLNLL